MHNKAIGCLVAALACSLAMEARAADCGQLRQINSVQMIRTSSEQDIVPLRINGGDLEFIFDTGGVTTSITREAAEKLHLRIQPTYMSLVNVAGGETTDRAFIDDFEIGRLHGKDLKFAIAPFKNIDGVLSLNFMLPYDIDVDFGTDKLNFFSQDHCPGGVQYWKADAVAVVHFVIENGHIIVPLTLEGEQVKAIVDTGASGTVLRMDLARKLFHLAPGDEATPEIKRSSDADPKLPKLYSHNFKSLTLGAIEVHNPHVEILEDVNKRDASHQTLVWDRTKTEKNLAELLPEMILGMNVLRKLHVYFAFAERKMYISGASQEAADKK